MGFVDTLSGIVNRIEGCAGAVILGIDGIPIERYVREIDSALDIDLVATEFTTLLRRSMRTASDTELGGLREMLFGAEHMTFLLRPITPEYFLMLALNPGGNTGRARFELRKAQLSLESEFAI
jgi:predicted regulator of Ras-like GTPase activity (Roadblock/LC7/MglB family)